MKKLLIYVAKKPVGSLLLFLLLSSSICAEDLRQAYDASQSKLLTAIESSNITDPKKLFNDISIIINENRVISMEPTKLSFFCDLLGSLIITRPFFMEEDRIDPSVQRHLRFRLLEVSTRFFIDDSAENRLFVNEGMKLYRNRISRLYSLSLLEWRSFLQQNPTVELFIIDSTIGIYSEEEKKKNEKNNSIARAQHDARSYLAALEPLVMRYYAMQYTINPDDLAEVREYMRLGGFSNLQLDETMKLMHEKVR